MLIAPKIIIAQVLSASDFRLKYGGRPPLVSGYTSAQSLVQLQCNKITPVDSDRHVFDTLQEDKTVSSNHGFENRANVKESNKYLSSDNHVANDTHIHVIPFDANDCTVQTTNPSSETNLSQPHDVNNNSQENSGDNDNDENSDRSVSNGDNPIANSQRNSVATLETQMEKVVAARKQLRFRLMLGTTVFGGVVAASSATIELLLSAHVLSEDIFGPPKIYSYLVFPFGTFMILGIMPTDTVAVRAMSVFLIAIFFLFTFLHIWIGCNRLFVERHKFTDFDGETTTYPCGSDIPELGCGLRISKSFLNAIFFSYITWSLRKNLQRVSGRTFYDKTRPKGFKFDDCAFKMSSRSALDSVWLHGRLMGGYTGLTALAYGLVFVMIPDRIPYFDDESAEHYFVSASINIALCLFYTPARRQYIVSFLTSVVVDDETRSAASVAACLGNANASDSLRLAKEKFRSINFSKLSADDFKKNTEESNRQNNLYDMGQPATLGGCDAFLSHSWHDNGEKKFEALQNWAEDFKSIYGRYPDLWLDKACVDQTNIASDLVCLPIFLAGCENLLIIAGPTYVERLWCIMEVFVFLQMGGSIQRITMIPIDVEGAQEASNLFGKVDITLSQCFLDSDRERLLGIVQQGFGSFDVFNEIIRQVFKDRVSSDFSFEEWQSDLQQVAQASKKLRRRIVWCTTDIGFVCLSTSMVMNQLISMAVLDERKFGLAVYYSGMWAPLGLVMLIGTMPNDAYKIRVLSLFLIHVFVGFAALDFDAAATLWYGDRKINQGYDGTSTIHACGSDLPYAGCGVHALDAFSLGCTGVVTSLLMLPNLWWTNGVVIYDRKKQKGFRWNDTAFKSSSRTALRQIWFCGRLWAILSGVSNICFSLALHLLDERAPFYTQRDFVGNFVFAGIARTIMFFVFNEDRRGRIKAFISSLHAHDQTMSAACVGALLGGHNITDILTITKEKFRCIRFKDLLPEDFDKIKVMDDPARILFSKASAIELGSCDVFISHSWSDDSSKKYEALQQWTQEFQQKNERQPTFWFDGACVDQNDISVDLLCLPIFLSGCETLLILAGPTYTERLWCVMEVFVFLKMGGSIDRITILPIDTPTDEAFKRSFQTLDVNTCQCSLEHDRQRLLGVVEQAFGNIPAFNKIVQQLFQQKNLTSVRSLASVHRPLSVDDAGEAILPSTSNSSDTELPSIL